jgi:hypothetical protein
MHSLQNLRLDPRNFRIYSTPFILPSSTLSFNSTEKACFLNFFLKIVKIPHSGICGQWSWSRVTLVAKPCSQLEIGWDACRFSSCWSTNLKFCGIVKHWSMQISVNWNNGREFIWSSEYSTLQLTEIGPVKFTCIGLKGVHMSIKIYMFPI